MKLFLIGLSAFLMTAIAVAQERLATQAYIGQSTDLLVATWGAPDDVYALTDGNKKITYVDSTIVYQKVGAMPRREKINCTTTFILNKDDVIESSVQEGPRCG